MSAQWKPGDVAIRRDGQKGDEQRSLAVSAGCDVDSHVSAPHWHHANGGWDEINAHYQISTYRPLVVIDPEDREQVQEFAEIWRKEWVASGRAHTSTSAMQAALREFANPTPAIEEPTGLGAVIEAINDNRYVHLGAGKWSRVDKFGDPMSSCEWAEIAVVEILSPGWSA